MPDIHFTNLLIVVAVGLLAPLALGFFPRFRLPAIVLEIVLGIVIGPSGLGWVKPDLPVSILALVGLAFLLFLSGLEIDVERLRGRVLKLTALGFARLVRDRDRPRPRAEGGRVRPVAAVRGDRARRHVAGRDLPGPQGLREHHSSFGQLVIAAASIAEFGAIILLSLFFSGKGSTSTTGTLILLGVFGRSWSLVGLAIAGVRALDEPLARAASASRTPPHRSASGRRSCC